MSVTTVTKQIALTLENGEHVAIETYELCKRRSMTKPSGESQNSLECEDTEHTIIFLHPHPKLGGDPQNNVVMLAGRAFAGQGFRVVLPDLQSISMSWTGKRELQVVKSLLAHEVQNLSSNIKLFMVGYSFGSCLALAASAEYLYAHSVEGESPSDKKSKPTEIMDSSRKLNMKNRLGAVICVSYPCGFFARVLLGWMKVDEIQWMRKQRVPLLFISGEWDQFSSHSDMINLKDWIVSKEGANPPSESNKELKLIFESDADHFWMGLEDLVAEHVLDFLKEQLKPG